MSHTNKDSFITVVAVGSEDKTPNGSVPKNALNHSDFVTVLTISNDESKSIADITEEVVVYRLPGERLGFGLKFEGGTKANEFVKRLFIQSCAPDSPASRVQSSWGQLVEGDEVLQIESVTVNSMTRIDCVRLLKDSNVAIKLLVRHYCDNKQKSRSTEDLPVIISTEEKRPPPVPPRKIPRKILKNPPKEIQEQHVQENIVPSVRQSITNESFFTRSSRLQSPRNSGRSLGKSYYSPDVTRRDRKFSDGSLGPPDAEVYMDLFSQESTQSLSESDETGSTISTVLDRFGSFPTTTTSSVAGSLPSTPTSMQKQLDLSYIINDYDDEELSNVANNNPLLFKLSKLEENNNNITNGTEVDPLCFQDAPLSYGNENTNIFPDDALNSTLAENIKNSNYNNNVETTKIRPAIIPRSRDKIQQSTLAPEVENSTLPRLVDFLPKSPHKKDDDTSVETLKQFLESERFDFRCDNFEDQHDENDLGIDVYNSKWILSSHLDTIGEVEEEGLQEIQNNYRLNNTCTPLVIIEKAESSKGKKGLEEDNETILHEETNELMEGPPIDFRQPPDGHEFPDFVENSNKPLVQNYVKHQEVVKFDKSNSKSSGSNYNDDTMNKSPKLESINLLIDKSISSSNCDLRLKMYESDDETKFIRNPLNEKTNLHTRSQSLIDMSIYSKEKNSKWNSIIEQRRKGLSKLKGLVIPEQTENEVSPNVIIPEIKSFPPAVLANTNFEEPVLSRPVFIENKNEICAGKPTALTLTNSWAVNSAIPKYSPAFKRKSLQVYPTINKKNETEHIYSNYLTTTKIRTSDSEEMNPPKSLESISSPTRSDCSFDYISNTNKKCQNDKYECFNNDKTDNNLLQNRDFRVEDESDNDSAVSSSQSSYNSRFSPPLSPTRSYDPKFENYSDKLNLQNRLLKPCSVEAINRKNILASAKCRSGKDIKIGSPVIKRKTEETENIGKNETVEVQRIVEGTCQIKFSHETETAKTTTFADSETPPKIPSVSSRDKDDHLRTSHPVEVKKRSLVTKDSKSSFTESYSASSILAKRIKPVNVKALKQNFENSSSTSNNLPLFPKSFVHEPKTVVKKQIQEVVEIPKKITSEQPKQTKINSNYTLPEKVVKPEKSKKIKFVELTLEKLGGSLGITLAGGSDYEIKAVTVHRIRYGSVAYQDGRLNKGDRIISINGKNTEGLTHAEVVELLKEPCKKFLIETEECSDNVPSIPTARVLNSSTSCQTETKNSIIKSDKKPTNVITLNKDGAGLGFSIEGGKDSPKGDVPIIVKKIFTGGAAEKSGELKTGDEIIMLNDIDFTNLTRIEAWSLMKKIPDGTVRLNIFR